MHVIKKEEVAKGGDASNIGFGKKPVFKAKPKAGENQLGYFPGLGEEVSKEELEKKEKEQKKLAKVESEPVKASAPPTFSSGKPGNDFRKFASTSDKPGASEHSDFKRGDRDRGDRGD